MKFGLFYIGLLFGVLCACVTVAAVTLWCLYVLNGGELGFFAWCRERL